jgi:thiol-disulfide isomerase/thioredoxin
MTGLWPMPAGMHTSEVRLPVEGDLASFEGATGWLNSEPLTAAGLRGKVVVVDFWTYTCINWLRQLPYVRAWSDKYADNGLVVVGVHSPEFGFERDVDNIRRALVTDDVRYPVAIDSQYGVWRAFDNHFWPALYIADAEGKIRYHHYGEGEYERSEMVIQQLLAEAGMDPGREMVSVDLRGFDVPADWDTLRTPESYTGYDRAEGFISPEGLRPDKPQTYSIPTIEGQPATSNAADGRIAFRFQARDVNLVMGPAQRDGSVRYQVRLDGQPPGAAHGFDVDEQGNGTLTEQRLHQLIRQEGRIGESTIEITFQDPQAQVFCFTFG